jgi:hypothetical protein
MAESLGIFVTSNSHLDKLIKLCKAARKKGIEVNIFFSHLGTLLTKEPRFAELESLGKLSICKVGFENHGLTQPIPGINDKDYKTQAQHAELIEDCERYLLF